MVIQGGTGQDAEDVCQRGAPGPCAPSVPWMIHDFPVFYTHRVGSSYLSLIMERLCVYMGSVPMSTLGNMALV